MNEERIKAKAEELVKTQGIDPQVALRIAQDIDKSMDIELRDFRAKSERLKRQKNSLVAGTIIVSVFAIFFGVSFFLESIYPRKEVKWVLISEINGENASENLVKMKIPGSSEDAILSVIGEPNQGKENPELKLELLQSQLEVNEFFAVPADASADVKPTRFRITKNEDGEISVEYYDQNNKKSEGVFEIQNVLDQNPTGISFSAVPVDEQNADPVNFVIIKNEDGSMFTKSVDKDGKTKEFKFKIKDKE